MPPLLLQDSDNIFVKSPEPYYTNEGKLQCLTNIR
jgi:hypothetical protein